MIKKRVVEVKRIATKKDNRREDRMMRVNKRRASSKLSSRIISATILITIMILPILMSGCTEEKVICNKPYIKVGDSCCLDYNNNQVCDKDEYLLANKTQEDQSTKCEEQNQTFNCSQCEPVIVEREVEKEVTKYVCEKDMRVVDSIDDCIEPAAKYVYEPVKTNEEGTYIANFTVRPACRESYHAGEIHYELRSQPSEVTIQVKTSPDAPWEDVYKTDSIDMDKYLYFVICDFEGCTGAADFFLKPKNKYLLRAVFDYTNTAGNLQFSNEWVVDTTTSGEYMTKMC